MNILIKYSLPSLLAALKEYKRREGLGKETIMGLPYPTFIFLLFVSLVLWITAIILLARNYTLMPTWLVVVSILCLCIPAIGPIPVILIIMLTKK